MNPTVQTLRRAAALEGLSDATLALIPERMQCARHEPEATIVRYGDVGRSLHLVLSGSLRIRLTSASGRRLTYQLLEAGELFGEISAIDGLARTADVVVEEEAVIGTLDARAMPELIALSHEFATALLERLARLNRWLVERVFEYHTYDGRGRVYIELARLFADAEELTISDTDMAERVGTTRANVTRINGELKRRGIVERDRQTLKI